MKKLKKILSAPFNQIYNLFLWASGAELDVLDQAPIDKNKYFGIGGTIVFTALMASFAGGYAFFTAFREEVKKIIPEHIDIINGVEEITPEHIEISYSNTSILLSVFFGLFWGALIFNLDRYIVSTFGVGDGKKTISKQELIEAAPRLIMAIILGFVISTPLELKIFEKEIQIKVEQLKIEKSTELIAKDSLFYKEFDVLKIEKTNLDNVRNEKRINKELIIKNDVTHLDNSKENHLKDLNRKEGELRNAENRMHSAYRVYIKADKDTSENRDDVRIQQLRSSYLGKVRDKKALSDERDIIRKDIEDIDTDKQDKQDKLYDKLNGEIELLTTDMALIDDKLRLMEVEKSKKTASYKDTSENYDGFAAHLEALSMLTDEKSIVLVAKWFITLLFVFIEIAPILFKMMTERGPYDDIMDEIKYEARVKQLLRQSNLNEEINNSIKVHSDKNTQKLNAELLANEELLKSIAIAQGEIAQVAIDTWKKEQIKKVKEDPSSMIKSS